MERPTMKENLKGYSLEEAHKLYTGCPELYRHIVKLDEYIDELEDKLNNLVIADVGNCALYNDMPLVYNMCLSYRHDFELLNATEQEQLVFECKEWLRAYENNK